MTINILYPSHSGSPVAFAAQELSRCLAEIVADSIIILNNQNCGPDDVTLRLESRKTARTLTPSTSPQPEESSREAMTAASFSASTNTYGSLAAVFPLPVRSMNTYLPYIRKNSSPPAAGRKPRCATGASVSREPTHWRIFWTSSTGFRSWDTTASFYSFSFPIPLWPAGITTR